MAKIPLYVAYWLDEMLINATTYNLINVNSPNYKPQSPYGMGNIPAPTRPITYQRPTIRVAALILDDTGQRIVGTGMNFQAPNQGNIAVPQCAEMAAYQTMKVQTNKANPSIIYIKSTHPKVTPFKECLQELYQFLPDITVVSVAQDNTILFSKPISQLI